MMSHAVSAPIPIPTAEKRQWHDTFDLHNALPPYRKPLAPPAKKNTSASRSSSLLTTQARELANQWRTSMRDDFASPQNVAALRPQVGSRQQLAVQRAARHAQQHIRLGSRWSPALECVMEHPNSGLGMLSSSA